MPFNSLHFLVFFSLTTILYFLISPKNRWVVLLAASLYFYCTFDYRFLSLVALSIASSFYFAILSHKTTDESKKKIFLHFSVWINVSILCVFKYFNFFTESIAASFSNFGLHFSPFILDVVLPIGISFYTFQVIGYAFDVHYGVCAPEKNFGKYSLYVLFFPKLVSGPIEQSKNLLVQINKEHQFDYDRITSGLKLMGWGFFKKLCVADRLSYFADEVFQNPGENSSFKVIIGSYFLIFQIYADFSGYSDIAVGASRVFGFDMVKNFNRPFISQNLTQFWKRWHMSLYNWFFEYIYNPLSFYLREWGKMGIIITIFVTFTLSGLWHGAAFLFILYGVLQGIGVTTEYLSTPLRLKLKTSLPPTLYKYLGIFITFHFVIFSEIFFHVKNLQEVSQILSSFADFKKEDFGVHVFAGKSTELILSFIAIGIIIFSEFIQSKTNNYLSFHLKLPKLVRWTVYSLFILIIVFFGVFNSTSFVYAQF